MKKTTFTTMGSLATAVCLILGAGTAHADARPDAHYDNGYLATMGVLDTVDVLRNDVPTPGATWDLSTLKLVNPENQGTELVNSYTMNGYRNDGTDGDIFTATVANGKINFMFHDVTTANLDYQITDTAGKTFESTVEVQGTYDGVSTTMVDAFNISFEKREAKTEKPLPGAELAGESCSRQTIDGAWNCESLTGYSWFRNLQPALAGRSIIHAPSDITDQKWYTTGTHFGTEIESLNEDSSTALEVDCSTSRARITAHEASAPAGYSLGNGEITLCYTNKGWILDKNTSTDGSIRFTPGGEKGGTVTFLNTKLAPEVPIKAENDSTTGEYGVEQIADVLRNDTPSGTSTFTKVELLDAQGNAVNTLTTKGGIYTVNADNTISYKPANGFSGTDSPLTYRATDSNGKAITATLTATVKAAPVVNPPTDVKGSTAPDATTVEHGATATLNVLSNDKKGSTEFLPNTLTVKGADATQGTWSVVDGQVQFVPAKGFSGEAKATYTVKDAAGNEYSEAITVTVKAAPVVTPPVKATATGVDDHATTKQDTPVLIDALDNDSATPGKVEKDSLTIYGAGMAPQDEIAVRGGVFTIQDGKLLFTPSKGFYGESGKVLYGAGTTDGVTYTAQASVTVTKADEVTPPTKPTTPPTKPGTGNGTGTTTPKPGTDAKPGTGSNIPGTGNNGGSNIPTTPGPVIQTDMAGGSDSSTGLLGLTALSLLGGAVAALRRGK